jgi:hypothetical protein
MRDDTIPRVRQLRAAARRDAGEMRGAFRDYFKVASKIVDELPDAVDQLDTWISQLEASGVEPSGSAAFTEVATQIQSAEALRDQLAGVLDSVESGAISSDVEPLISKAGVVPSVETAATRIQELANVMERISTVEPLPQVTRLTETAEAADVFVSSVEKSPAP